MPELPSTDTTMAADAPPQEHAEGLIRQLKQYNKTIDEALIRKAVTFTVEHHGAQKRYSGDPYYYHPIAVANILTHLKLDQTSVITGLLHDVVEDTEQTVEDIAREFGDEIATLVDGVTKLTRIEFQSDNERQAENFRKFMLATSQDVRVLVVKLCDRLHNMRTLQYVKKPQKRKRIATETLEIYASLAERIGIQSIKDELQDIAFKELYQDVYDSIVSRLQFLRSQDETIVDRTVEQLKKVFDEVGMSVAISGREKRPYSVWRKMQAQNVSFEQLADIVGFRVMVDTEAECYLALGHIHAAFHAIPGSFKDYISTAKANGYQSLHTIVMGPEKQYIEIQIRTHTMHEIAEMGVAAHWAYKQGKEGAARFEGMQYQWMRELLSIIENAPDSKELMENTKMQMYHDQVFCFTPKGELIVLPQNATPVDFAFAVHTKVGHSCVGSKVNGRMVPLRTRLKNGDQVEILQSKSQHPSPSWEGFVVTGKALSEIRKYVRSEKAEEYQRLGHDILQQALAKDNVTLSDDLVTPIASKFGRKSAADIYRSVGNGTLGRGEVIRAIFPEKTSRRSPGIFDRLRRKKGQPASNERLSVPIQGLIPGMAIHYAGCCHPLPGEPIVGIVNTGKGVTIHTSDCHELEQYADQPERWLDVTWQHVSKDGVFVGRLKAVVHHRTGALAELANAIAQGGGNINNLRIETRAQDFFDMVLDVEVHDVDHLTKLMALLRSKSVIHTVERHSESRNYEG